LLVQKKRTGRQTTDSRTACNAMRDENAEGRDVIGRALSPAWANQGQPASCEVVGNVVGDVFV
jgi:hypothetical protein